MKEKFDRNAPKVNIGLIGKKENETLQEKIQRLKETKVKIEAMKADVDINNAMISIIDDTLDNIENKNTHLK